MRKGIFYTTIILLLGILLGSFMISKHVSFSMKHAEREGGVGEDAEEYYKWEQRRLADPTTGKIPENIRALELEYAATLPSDQNLSNDRVMSNPWASRGCWNIGGRTRAFAEDVSNEAVLLAGTCSGGMWRSADSGKSWTMVTPLAIEQSVSCVAQDVRPGHTNIWYYGSGEAFGASASATGAYFLGNGAYRSKDDGQTWQPLTTTINNSTQFSSAWQLIWNICSDPHAPGTQSVVYASTLGAVLRSADTGNTWTTVLGGDLTKYSYYEDVQVSDSGVVYATLSSEGSQPGIWRSPDGVTYTNITPAGFPTAYNRIVVGISTKILTKCIFWLIHRVLVSQILTFWARWNGTVFGSINTSRAMVPEQEVPGLI